MKQLDIISPYVLFKVKRIPYHVSLGSLYAYRVMNLIHWFRWIKLNI